MSSICTLAGAEISQRIFLPATDHLVLHDGTLTGFHYFSGFKTFLKPCYVGPLDSSFSAIVGPNGLGKTVLADAVRFALGANMASLRVKAAKESINHQLLQRLGSKAACSTEVGFVISDQRRRDSTSQCESNMNEDIRYLRVRRRVLASGQSTYYAACWGTLPGHDCFQDKLTPQSYVRF